MEHVFFRIQELWAAYMILWVIVAKVFFIAFIGFFRSVVLDIKPSYLWNQKDFLSKQIDAGNSFAVLLTPVFAVFGLAYNLIAWFIYGLTTIVDALIWVARWIWHWLVFVCRWIFENIIDPGFFYIVKMIWRYFIVWTWHFIRISWEHLRVSFPFAVYRLAFLAVLVITLPIVLVMIFIPVALPLAAAAGSVLAVYFTARILSLLNPGYEKSWAVLILKKTLKWVGILAGLLFLIMLFNYFIYGSFLQISLFGFNMGFTSLAALAALFFVILFAFSQSILPAAFHAYNGEIKEKQFITEIGKNFLKYIVGTPYALLPATLLMIIPAALVVSVYTGSEKVKDNILEMKEPGIASILNEKQRELKVILDTAKYSEDIDSKTSALTGSIVKKKMRLREISILHQPYTHFFFAAVKNYLPLSGFSDRISSARNEIANTDSSLHINDTLIGMKKAELELLDSMKNMVVKDGITTRPVPVEAEKEKKFGVTSIPGTRYYKWKVFPENESKEVSTQETQINTVMIKLTKAGNYKLEVYPVNDCGESKSFRYSVSFTVSPKVKSLILQKPGGPDQLCAGAEATFQAPLGYSEYEFTFPKAVEISSQKNNVVTVVWGTYSGDVKFTAVDKEGDKFNSNARFVKVNGKPGDRVTEEPHAGDLTEPASPSEPLFFFTLEEADQYIDAKKAELTDLENEHESLLNKKVRQTANLKEISHQRAANIWFDIKYTIGLLILALAFAVLASLVLPFLLIYITRFNYFLFSFRREGRFYIAEEYHRYHDRNVNQPLMGLLLFPVLMFVLMILIRLLPCFNHHDCKEAKQPGTMNIFGFLSPAQNPVVESVKQLMGSELPPPPPPPPSGNVNESETEVKSDSAVAKVGVDQQSDEVFLVVDQPPTFPGGDKAMADFLASNLRYPEEAKELGIQGRVYLSFIVEKDGSLSNISVLKGIGSGCDEECVRVISRMPDWSPGKQKNEIVRYRYYMPVKFYLN